MAEQNSERGGGPRGAFGRIVGSVVSPIVSGVDVDEVVNQIDVNDVVARIDIDDVVARIDVNDVVARIDINDVVDRVDIDRLVVRVDIDQLLDRIDPDELLDRVDPNRLLDRVDADRLLERVDVNQLVARTEISEIIARSTTGVFTQLLDVARTQIILADQVVQGVPARILRRMPRELPPHPSGVVEQATTMLPGVSVTQAGVDSADEADAPVNSQEPRPSAWLSPGDRAVKMQGRFAGSVSRFLAFVVDQFTIGLIFALGALLVQSAIRVVFRSSFEVEQAGIGAVIAFVTWSFLYTAGSLAATGRTIGKAVMGLLVTRTDGSRLGARRAALRQLVFPLSFLLLGIGLLIGLVRRDRRELHDLVADTGVVYAWDADTAQLRSGGA